MTWSVSSRSQVDRPPAPASIPGTTKALVGASSPTSPQVRRMRQNLYLPPVNDLTDQSKM